MHFQASVITTLLLGLLIIPSLMIILIPLMDKILNQWFLDYINSSIINLDILIWSSAVNYILIMLWVIMFLIVFRFILRSVSVFK